MSNAGAGHVPVLRREALAALAPRDGEVHVDATFGGGGYARAILDAAACTLIALDRDRDAIARGAALVAEFAPRLTLKHAAFGDIEEVVARPVDGVVLDIGVSSYQVDEAERGFSFQNDGPLDMRMDREGPSAADAVNALSEAALAELIADYGEDDDARRIARVIVQARAAERIERTGALAALVERAVGGRRGARTHPATKTFQALRILVNDELAELARALTGAERLLKPGGRLVVVSFHSLEDRLVKTFLYDRAGQRGGGSRHQPETPPERAASFRLEERRMIAPGEAELAANPRSRSAALRWAVRTDAPAWHAEPALERALRARQEWSRLS
ncbi:MAG: 16S rRNA (cytosine(1402)-N(4))-methyltransferase RsmH [Alphaproteobacteria bacterium]|nr:16S rRNA (cytosine(1402)-N(4))-methyltransferase RsmH [Alphaproteobacteria bacterium]